MTEISDWRYRRFRYQLIGSRCRECGETSYPPRSRCARCGGATEEYRLPRRGRVVHYTLLKALPSRFNRYRPYYLAVVELSDGTRVVGMLTDVDEPSVGMEVEATLRKLYTYGEDGKIIYGVKFRPVL